jgi:hypothetical protein
MSPSIFDQQNCLSFIVKNISPQKKTIHIFNYPIKLLEQRDLLAIPGIGESDISESLLKGEIRHKFLVQDIQLVYSNIELLQFTTCEKEWLSNLGFNIGLDVGVSQLASDTIDFITTSGGTSGITISQHETLKQLIHFINEGPGNGFATGAFKEILPVANPFPTSIIWWESSEKLKKIISKTLTYNLNKTPSTILWEMYAEDGVTVISTILDTISYSGVFETTRTRSIS